MKKAKIVLSAVALFAVIGGAFAFKAARGTGSHFATAGTSLINGSIYQLCQPQKNYRTAQNAPERLLYTSTTTVNNITVCTSTPFTLSATTVAVN
jgi:predicted phage tail protein